ncbi:hypothetical protein IMSAGC007_00056 [Lachnospiraceae bacterium]|nr:hypothetical protein IMSAGC007_00056 [Lachnospiraceae bacterium]
MSITGTQTSIYNGLTFGPYLKKSVDESRSDTTERSFQNLLRQGGQDKQDLAGEEAESTVQAEVEEAKKLLKNYQTVLVKEILYGTSNAQYQEEKKRNKKYQLFKSDNGVFGDKTLEEMVNPTDNPKATWNSAQSKKLTKDQLRYLKENYNITDISNEDFCGILMELVDMQVLSREEAEKYLLRDVQAEVAQTGYRVTSQKAAEKEAELERKQNSQILQELLQQLLENKEDLKTVYPTT